MNHSSYTPEAKAAPWPGNSQFDVGDYARTTSIMRNRVIRNTYALLALTLLFSAAVATASTVLKLPAPGIIVTLVGYFGLLFAVHKLQNSAWALPAVFGLAGFMGYTLGPILTRYSGLANGGEVIGMAFGATAVTFWPWPRP